MRRLIKIIDYAKSSRNPVSPNKLTVVFSAILSSIILAISVIYIHFLIDNKIHTKKQLTSRLPNIPVIGEIPFIANKENLLKIFNNRSRNPLFESIRIMVANLNFTNLENKSKGNIFLVTSSIKGEGKTIVSVNTAASLSKNNNNVLLLGADLRNPQIHKFIGLSKSKKGISDYIYNDNLNWESCIIKNEKFDILLSGTIPPNPTELLSSQKFNRFIDEIKKIYDYIIIDSAPCLLVSDTFEISKFVDSTIYVTRSNFSNLVLCDFIKECHINKKLKNINIVLNSVGNSQSYGYKYGYQYGYKYGYNYGYGYGYKEDS